MDTIAQRIARSRESKGLTQAELARLVNVSRATASRWESDTRTPKRDSLIALAAALDISLDWLINGE